MTQQALVALWCDLGAHAPVWRVRRVLALVDELTMRGSKVMLVDVGTGPSWTAPHLGARGLDAVPAPEAPAQQTRLYQEHGVEAVVVDASAVDSEVCTVARRSGRPTLALADAEALPDADVVVHPGLGAEGTRPPARGGPTVLAGTDYALLGNDVLANRPIGARTPGTGEVPRVGVVLDASVPWSATPVRALVRALVATRLPFDASVVVPEGERLRADDGLDLRADQRVRALPASGRLYDHAARWHVVLTLAGPSTYDWLCLGLPVGAAWASQEQVGLYRGLMVRRTLVGLGSLAGVDDDAASAGARLARLLGDPRERGRLAEAGWRLVDGLGRARVVDALLALL